MYKEMVNIPDLYNTKVPKTQYITYEYVNYYLTHPDWSCYIKTPENSKLAEYGQVIVFCKDGIELEILPNGQLLFTTFMKMLDRDDITKEVVEEIIKMAKSSLVLKDGR